MAGTRIRRTRPRKGDHMKRMAYVAAAILIVWATRTATAQSLGDYARAARKQPKTQHASASHKFDNDNLPRDQQLSVVGAEPAPPPATADSEATADAKKAPKDQAAKDAKDPKAAAAERQKAQEALQQKIDAQKQKIDSLAHEIDLMQREYRLKEAAFYGDAGNRLRNAAQWDKDDTKYKQDLAGKQKELDTAKQELDSLQEQARKAGMRQKD